MRVWEACFRKSWSHILLYTTHNITILPPAKILGNVHNTLLLIQCWCCRLQPWSPALLSFFFKLKWKLLTKVPTMQQQTYYCYDCVQYSIEQWLSLIVAERESRVLQYDGKWREIHSHVALLWTKIRGTFPRRSMSSDIMKILHDVPNTYVDFFVSLIVKIICPP